MAQADESVARGIIAVVHFARPGLYLRKEVVLGIIGIVRRDAVRVLDSSPR